MHLRTLLALCAVAVLFACERTSVTPTASPDPRPLRLAAPERGFRLTTAERASIAEGFDVDALERLLARVRPDMRPTILAYFRETEEGESRGQLLQIFDPELQPILEEVWAPMWDDVPDDALEKRLYDIPGWHIARQRREERRAKARGDGSD
ncbi:MAG TPA: hypothetical protein VFQ39_08585 [Longimicrobium sp.]|nr:hypothetical protein [Longimicrobium sp.]